MLLVEEGHQQMLHVHLLVVESGRDPVSGLEASWAFSVKRLISTAALPLLEPDAPPTEPAHRQKPSQFALYLLDEEHLGKGP